MRAKWIVSAVGAIATLLGIGLVTACSKTDNTALAQIRPGQTVFADLWDESDDEGDQAQVEQKPSGMWIINVGAKFRSKRTGNFDVQITLNKTTGTFDIVDMGSTKVGKEHDDCLSLSGDHEHYANMLDKTIQWEKNVPKAIETAKCYEPATSS